MAHVRVDVEAIRRSQAAGNTQLATAHALGISLTAVAYHWQRAEKPGRPRGSQHAAQIAAMITDGKTDREISEALGVSVSTVNRQRRTSKDGQ